MYSFFRNDQPPPSQFFLITPFWKLLSLISATWNHLFIYLSQKMLISSKLFLEKKNSTQCIILLLFLLFSQIKMAWIDPPPPIKDKENEPPVKTKGKIRVNLWRPRWVELRWWPQWPRPWKTVFSRFLALSSFEFLNICPYWTISRICSLARIFFANI